MYIRYRVILLMLHEKEFMSAFEEIGICLIASYLRQNNIHVLLLNEIEDQLDYEHIQAFKPDMIGFTVYQANMQGVMRTAAKIKNQFPDCKICVGGVFPTYAPGTMLEQCDAIDFSIHGEGEFTMNELIRALNTGEKDLADIAGLAYRSSKDIVINKSRSQIKNLDRMPFMARDFLQKQPIRIANIGGSRGCCAKCSFCAKQLFFKKWIGRSIDNILDEITIIQNVHQVDNFMFMDSSFEDPGHDLGRMKDLARGLLQRGLFINYYFNIRADFYKKVDPETMTLLKRSGLSALGLGIESGNQSELTLFKKGVTLEDNYRIMEFIRQHDLRVFVGFINFTPYSDIDSLRSNLDFLENFGLPFSFFTSLEVYGNTSIHSRLSNDKKLNLHYSKDGGTEYSYANTHIGDFYQHLNTCIHELEQSHPGLFNTLNQKNKIIPLQMFYYKTKVEKYNDEILTGLYTRNQTKYEILNKKLCSLLFNWIRDNLDVLESKHHFRFFSDLEIQQLLILYKQYLSVYDDLHRIAWLIGDAHE